MTGWRPRVYFPFLYSAAFAVFIRSSWDKPMLNIGGKTEGLLLPSLPPLSISPAYTDDVDGYVWTGQVCSRRTYLPKVPR